MRQVDEDIQNPEIALLERHLERLHVQPVPGEHTAVIAPSSVRGRTPAARAGAIDHVVVNQRGAVQQLNDRGETNGAAVHAPGIIRGKK